MNGSIHQQTLKNSVRATGLALHTGKQVNVILGPGPVDSGIVFRRTDLNEEMSVHAHALNVGSTHMATSLTNGEDEISNTASAIVNIARFSRSLMFDTSKQRAASVHAVKIASIF